MLYEIEINIQQQMIHAQNQVITQNPAPTPEQLPLTLNSQPLSPYKNQLKNANNLFSKKPQMPIPKPIVQPTNKNTNTQVILGIRTPQNNNTVANPKLNTNIGNNSNNHAHVHNKQCNHNHPHQHINTHRPLTQTWLNPSFVLCHIAFIAYIFTFIYEFVAVSKPSYWILALVLYLVFYSIALWAYYKTVFSQPGPIPLFCGLAIEKNKQSLRKYCMLCHNFKPERSHHCSRCQKCILNMDHHCPWINNCVGFNNRKYFLQFLFYISISLIYSVTIEIIVIVEQTRKLTEGQPFTAHYVIKWLVLIFSAPIGFLLIIFSLYHLGLVLKNITTLQLLINQKSNKNKKDLVNPTIQANVGNQEHQQQIYNYNVGKGQNFMQVFGENPIWWFIPLAGNGPKGDGIQWPKEKGLTPNIFINKPIQMTQKNELINQTKTTTTLPLTMTAHNQKQISSSVRLKGLQENYNNINLEQTYENDIKKSSPTADPKMFIDQPQPYYIPTQQYQQQIINHSISNINRYQNQTPSITINYNNNKI